MVIKINKIIKITYLKILVFKLTNNLTKNYGSDDYKLYSYVCALISSK